MSIKMLHKFDKIIGPLGIFLFCSVITFIWFRKGLMFAGGEEGLPLYNPSKYLALISHIWHDANGGSPAALFLPRIPYAWTLAVLYKLGVGPVFLQALSFFALIITGCLSVFYLTKKTIGEDLEGNLKKIVPFLASFFYFFNPYSMSQVWGRGIYGQFFGFALIPLFLLLFILGLKRRKPVFGILAIFASFLFSASFVVTTQAIILWIPPLVYFIFHVAKNIKDRKVLIFSFFYGAFILLGWFFSNFWWIYPILQTGKETSLRFFADTNNINSFIGSSKLYFKPEYVIRLLQGFLFFIADYYGGIYKTFPFGLISWLIPLVAAFSLLYIKKLWGLRFFVVLFLVGFFLSIGANPPLGSVLVWLFVKIPFLQAFRNPYEKAGLLLMLAYTPLFGLGLYFLSIKLASLFKIQEKRLLSLIFGTMIVILVCGIYVWPLWTGKFTNSWVRVPDYYKEANNWLNSQKGDFRIMQMPLIGGDGVRYDWQFPYQGIEPGEFLFTKSSIGRNIAFNKIFYNVLTQRLGTFSSGAFGPDPDISKSEFRSDEFWQELEKLDVRYIVFHNDLNENVAGVKIKPAAEYLSKQKNIKLIKTFGKLDIYEVNIPGEISLIYSPGIQTSYKKINPTQYEVNVLGAKGKTDIYFLELFDSNWEASIDEIKQENHGGVFDYANKWTINKNGNYKIVIKYSPQDHVLFSEKVSGVSLFFLSVILISIRLIYVNIFMYR